MRRKTGLGMYDLAGRKCQVGLDLGDLILGDREIIPVEHGDIRPLARLDLTFLTRFPAEPSPGGGPNDAARRADPGGSLHSR